LCARPFPHCRREARRRETENRLQIGVRTLCGLPLQRPAVGQDPLAQGRHRRATSTWAALTRVHEWPLELGGNDPAIVLDDVDPNAVVDGLFWGAFTNSGQVCTAIKRLYVHEKVYAPIVDGLVERAKAAKVGDGLDAATQLGPINNKMQFDKVVALVDDAKQHGGRIAAGGAALDRPGYFYPPTIVTGVGAGVRLVDGEQFGPALPIIAYRNVDDVIEEANRTHYGLGGSVWTSNLERGEQLVQQLESGTGWVNQHMDITPFAPFGGCKWSGLGYENGKWGYEEFTELQVVNTKK